MNKRTGFIIITILFFMLSAALFNKHNELKNIVFDGDGIGLYFLGVEINDTVPNEQVATYALRFLIATIISFIVALFSLYISFQKKLTRQV
jgi:hypothetical protein